ncbi:hypothetical protein V2J09_023921 [Rumex salicifolius]
MAIEDPNFPSPTMTSKLKPNAANQKNVTFFALFSAADRFDFLLMIFGSIGSAIHGACVSYFFILFGNLIDSLGRLSSDPLKLSNEVSKYSLYLVYLGLLVFASAWMGVAFWMQTGERQTTRLRLMYLEAVFNKDMRFFDTEAEKDNVIFHISSDAILVQDAISEKVGHSIRYLSQFVVGFAIGFSSVWQLTVITLAVVPLIAVSGGAYAVTMSSISKKTEAAYAEAAKAAEESISQIRTVQSNVGEEKAIEVYSRSLQSALKLGKKSGFAKGIGIGCTYGLLLCSWALLIWYASLLVRRNNTNGGKAFTTIVNVIYSGFALGQAAPNLAAIAKGKAAATKILNMIHSKDSSSTTSDQGTELSNIVGRIEFSKVSFSYPSRSKTVFEDLSFSVDAGKILAVVGHSGSGKSTVISLLQRFYQPISGKILLDGNDLQDLQLKWLREQMGLVSQEPVLFATSIAENILYGNEKADMEQVIKASEAANAHSFIKALPDGYYTQVGEGGAQLSGGQKQRIAIARAVLRNPKILLLDEATSALDSESEMIIQKALDQIKSNRTTIVVAHRLSTIYGVDKIILINNGCVVETGTHNELMDKGKEYATLVKIQGSDYNNESPMKETNLTVLRPLKSIELNATSQTHQSVQFQELRTPKKEEIKQKSGGYIAPSLKEVVKLSAPEWPFALLGSIGAALAGIEPTAFALGITYILNSFYSHNDSQIKHDVKIVSLVFLGLAFATIPIYLLQHYFSTLMGERITTRVRLLMFSAMLSNEIGWFDLDENNIGSLTSILAADATLVRSSMADKLPTMVQNITLTLCAFAVSFTLCWRIAAVTVGIFPLLIGSFLAENLFLRGFGGNYCNAYSRATSLAREAIANIRTVASFGAEKRISRQYSMELSLPKKQTFFIGHISGICYGASQLFSFLSYALTLYYASTLIRNKYSNFGNIMKSFMMLMVTAFSMAEAVALTPETVKGSQALNSVFRILKRKTNIETNNLKSQAVRSVKGDIEFKSITFNYPSRPDVTILKDMSLKISAGTSVAVLGQSGSGKSTLISLVMRFYDPTMGSILIDGVDIRTLNLRSLRLQIGLVQQEPALFSTTIYDNIRYGKENATEIEITEAAKAANAHGFISKMPEGYKTHVGEKGVQLSGGQKQRIAIARAILKDPGILLLDEATSALDTASEKLVQEALEKVIERRTTIVVAHRLSTIKKADCIAVLEKGRVVESGSHDQLLKRPAGCYAQLINLQQRSMQQKS